MPGIEDEERRYSFSAAFTLVNRSGADIDFELVSHCGEEKPVQFILRNAEDEILWQYIRVNPVMGGPDFLENWVSPGV